MGGRAVTTYYNWLFEEEFKSPEHNVFMYDALAYDEAVTGYPKLKTPLGS